MSACPCVGVFTVNPARAGMIPADDRGDRLAERKPRASGDDPALTYLDEQGFR